MGIFGRLFRGGGGGHQGGGNGGGGQSGGGEGGQEPERRPRDLCSDSRERVFQVAVQVVHQKYGRTVRVEPRNIERGVTMPDCLLVAFYWHAQEMMAEAGVRQIEDLTGSDKAVIGLMAVAFDLDDAAFAALCLKLTPAQVEKARIFRDKWVSAAKTEPRMAEIQRDARDRALQETEARAARVRAVQALHAEPDVAKAYALGCQQLQSGQPLGAPGAPLYFLLPYGVQRARALDPGTCPVRTEPPPYSSLMPQEMTVVRHLHTLLSGMGDVDTTFDLMTRRPQVETETGLIPTLAAAFSGHPMPPEALPYGTDKRSSHWPEEARLPASFPSLFDAVLAIHANWNGPLPGLDMKNRD